MLPRAILITICCFLCSCAAAGVVATSDPNQKLKDAYYLLKENRPYPAERLTKEAITGFKEQKDYYGLGLAEFMYGQFVMSENFDWPLFRKQYPNTDTTEQRKAFAEPYFQDAISNFHKAASDPKLSHDVRTGYYWREYLVHKQIKDNEGMCGALKNMNSEHEAYLKENPGAKVTVQGPYTTFEEFMAESVRDAKCKGL